MTSAARVVIVSQGLMSLQIKLHERMRAQFCQAVFQGNLVLTSQPCTRYSAPTPGAIRLEQPHPSKRIKQSVSNPFDNVPDVGEFAFYNSQAAVAHVLPALLLTEPMDPFDEHLNVSLHCNIQKGNVLSSYEPH